MMVVNKMGGGVDFHIVGEVNLSESTDGQLMVWGLVV